MSRKLLLILFLAGFSIIRAQSVYEFLDLDLSPRAAALAGSFVASNDDPNVLFYNPAGTYFLNGRQISFSFLKHLKDINSAGLVFSDEIESVGRLSAGISYINYGDFQRADEFGNKTGEFGAGDVALMAAYSNELDKNLSYGASVKFIYSGIDEYSSTAAAVDLGLLYAIPEERWSFGFSILNAGAQITTYNGTKEDLPLDFRLGFSKELLHLPLKFFFAFNHLNSESEKITDRFKKFTFGGELRLSRILKLRFGYDNEKRSDLKIGSSAGLAGFNLGLGAIIDQYLFDYAFSSLGSIGTLHRIGITTEF